MISANDSDPDSSSILLSFEGTLSPAESSSFLTCTGTNTDAVYQKTTLLHLDAMFVSHIITGFQWPGLALSSPFPSSFIELVPTIKHDCQHLHMRKHEAHENKHKDKSSNTSQHFPDLFTQSMQLVKASARLDRYPGFSSSCSTCREARIGY